MSFEQHLISNQVVPEGYHARPQKILRTAVSKIDKIVDGKKNAKMDVLSWASPKTKTCQTLTPMLHSTAPFIKFQAASTHHEVDRIIHESPETRQQQQFVQRIQSSNKTRVPAKSGKQRPLPGTNCVARSFVSRTTAQEDTTKTSDKSKRTVFVSIASIDRLAPCPAIAVWATRCD